MIKVAERTERKEEAKTKVLRAILREEVAAGEAGYWQIEPGERLPGVPSTFPAYYRNKGYQKSRTFRMLFKVETGLNLTPKQQSEYDDLMSGLADQIKASHGHYNQEVIEKAAEITGDQEAAQEIAKELGAIEEPAAPEPARTETQEWTE